MELFRCGVEMVHKITTSIKYYTDVILMMLVVFACKLFEIKQQFNANCIYAKALAH